jgi:hypothetical protein
VLCADVWALPLPFVWVPFGAAASATLVSGFQYVYLVSRRVAEQERAQRSG